MPTSNIDILRSRNLVHNTYYLAPWLEVNPTKSLSGTWVPDTLVLVFPTRAFCIQPGKIKYFSSFHLTDFRALLKNWQDGGWLGLW